MAKNQNSAEKRRREVEKKFKAEEKRQSRLKRKSVETDFGSQSTEPTNEQRDPPREATV